MIDISYITGSDSRYVDSQYEQFLQDPDSLDPDLKHFFEGFDFAVSSGRADSADSSSGESTVNGDWTKEINVYRLILGYRNKGHLIADTNPIRPRRDRQANLDLSFFKLSEKDLDTPFVAGCIIGLGKKATLREILNHLQNCYASHVGIEFKYISDHEKRAWLLDEIEHHFTDTFSLQQQAHILDRLNHGVIFEKFLNTKYVGQKRFSLEGGETTIAALDWMINTAAAQGVEEVVIGMAHRGRLNVLANVLGKTYEQIFSEFETSPKIDQTMGNGDVKYHLGFGSDVVAQNGKTVHLKLIANPSHLEAVDPVVEGFARSKADIVYDSQYARILPILIHGDASAAGQGILYELLQMSKLKGYYTGGTLHFVINNQIGFTTDFDDARSSDYCTSLASMIQAPVLHVNGDDPEAVVRCSDIAVRYREKFNSDIFVDMVCYRRHGHNEGDDPKYTQPGLYQLIEKHPDPREVYTSYLLKHGEPDAQQMAKDLERKFWADLQSRLDEVKQHPLPYTYQPPELAWKKLRSALPVDFESSPDTSIAEARLRSLFDKIMTLPADFRPLRKVEKLLDAKRDLLRNENKIDWATGELLAYARLLSDGKIVRMSGEDVKRGTFSHRHAVLRDVTGTHQYFRLNGIGDPKHNFKIYNSLLSEYGVLGFEYGYAMANPDALVLWEAQFGDFANGAQTIIDEFIASAEVKWNRMNGMVLLLPHGYEGQGPDHSSGRIERYLQLCANLNMVITNVTTAANLFHVLCRQLTWPFRKPLINFSPKGYLRYEGTYSKVDDFIKGGFKEVLDDPFLSDETRKASVKKVLLCSGKLYFELDAYRKQHGMEGVAIVRLEQIYPVPVTQLKSIHEKYGSAIWYFVQEEPLNMGAASFLKLHFTAFSFGILSRKESAACATGFSRIHKAEQEELIKMAFDI